MDAISFVLGIRSSHLRSAQLRDLVYRGRVMKTSKIQDDGTAAQHEEDDGDGSSQRTRGDPKSAWVMAVYEDDAGDQKKWKRTITSSGSSEFRINDRVVTAAQYNEALEAENILIKARNFLVFQGDVEAIASQSPQDLTRLIEQISGSLEYKAEYERLKAEAEQAAENQNFQLHKRRGINSEIKQYQDQKKEADNYQKKTEERDEAVATHILWKLYHFQRVMDETYEQIKDHQENLKEFHRNKKSLETRLETARKEQATVGREVSKIEKNIRTKEKSIEDRENSLVPINEKIAQSNHNLEMIKKKIESVSKQRDAQAASIEKAKKDLATVEKAQQHFERQWAETLKKQGRELSDADRKEYNRLRAQAMAKSSENKAKLDNLLRQLRSDEVTVNSLKGKVDTFNAAMEKLQAEIDFIKAKMGTTEEVVRDITAELDGKKKEFNKVQSERIRVNNLRTELEEKYQEVLKKLAEADDGRRQNDKEARTKQMVNDLKRLYPGVRGRVGELCKPKQKKFEEAVIVAIGRDFDSVIVDTERAAIDCVQFLKEQRFPPLTFIPLDNIKVNTVNSAVKGIPGVRLAIDTIDFDHSLERAMSYACGSSIVCDSLDIAKNVCFQRNIQVKAVTLEGYVIHKGGLMTGGKTPESKGNKRKFEEHDVQNLRKMEEKIRGELEKLPRDRRGAAEETLQNDLTGLEQRLRLARSELEAFEKNLQSKQKEINSQRRGLEEYEPKLEEKEGELERTRATVAKFEAAISEVEDKIFADFCRRLGYEDIRAYEAQQGSLEEEAAQKRQDFEVQKSKLQNNLKWEEARYQTEKDRVTQMERSLQNAKRDIEAFAAQKAEIEEAMGEDRDELEALNERYEEIREQHAEKAKRVNEIKQELQKKNKEIEARQKAIDAGVTEIQRNSSLKFALLRRCKLEQIQIPLAEGSLEDVPGEDALLQEQDEDAMDVDGDEDNEERALEVAMDNHGIEVDFDSLDEDLQNVSSPVPASAPLCSWVMTNILQPDEDAEHRLQERINSLTSELEKLNPNMKAMKNLEVVKSRLENTEQEFEDARAAAKAAKDAYNEVKTKRFELFDKAFKHIQEAITTVYKDLTRSDAYPLGGQAYLDIEEDTDTPYLSGVKYHAMPPLKRFRDMEHLSGGEKTMAALALLFAIHSYSPSPFFVLDEVDAALDNANVDKIKKYIMDHSGPGMQFIVISLKTGLFQDSESLIGVYRDQDVNSSKTLTLDVSCNFSFALFFGRHRY